MTQSGLMWIRRLCGGGEDIELNSESQERLSCCDSRKMNSACFLARTFIHIIVQIVCTWNTHGIPSRTLKTQVRENTYLLLTCRTTQSIISQLRAYLITKCSANVFQVVDIKPPKLLTFKNIYFFFYPRNATFLDEFASAMIHHSL